jgi:hypothetical protein
MMKEWLAGDPVGIEDGLRHFVSQRLLDEAKLPVRVEFAPLPFALYRAECT